MIRGDFLRQGVEVQAGHAGRAAAAGARRGAAKPTRLDLARWLVDPANPLTARVAVNWVWQQVFRPRPGRHAGGLRHPGRQAVASRTARLAGDRAGARRNGSLKALHKLIVTFGDLSAVVERPAGAGAARPAATCCWPGRRGTRLEAEILRDEALAASGLLVRTVGGPSVRPPQPAGISELTYAGSARWVESIGPDRYRRGMYTWFQRTSPYPMLMTFDAPDSNVCCVRRDRSNTPLQALTLLNDTVFVECAQALGRRMTTEEKGGTRGAAALRLPAVRGARADGGGAGAAGELYADLLALCKADPEKAAKLAGPNVPPGADVAEAAAWTALARALLNLDEFVTRE